jgi:hypothetical protein
VHEWSSCGRFNKEHFYIGLVRWGSNSFLARQEVLLYIYFSNLHIHCRMNRKPIEHEMCCIHKTNSRPKPRLSKRVTLLSSNEPTKVCEILECRGLLVFLLDPPQQGGLDVQYGRQWNIIPCMLCRTPCPWMCSVGESIHSPTLHTSFIVSIYPFILPWTRRPWSSSL